MMKKIAGTMILVAAFTGGDYGFAPKADAHHYRHRLSCHELALGARRAAFHQTGSYRAARHAYHRTRNRCVKRRAYRRRYAPPRVLVFPGWAYVPY
jgi:hypothetical protein